MNLGFIGMDDNIVSQVKTPETDGIFAFQIGCRQKKEKHLTKPEVGHFRSQGVPRKRKLREFPVTEDALLPLGTSISFIPGQYVDVTGITKGKGIEVLIVMSGPISSRFVDYVNVTLSSLRPIHCTRQRKVEVEFDMTTIPAFLVVLLVLWFVLKPRRPKPKIN
ncbi:unnamed protein product [Fraxinus pennsylvanica]|uniref:Uncharacterized protein n=1 Tax=Fraxinus pennsylvanica TaxID=56036 RepID=A0AAD2ADS8_9LAMI|nr:unnamed protein product [Fraxinus pennsylvanica]